MLEVELKVFCGSDIAVLMDTVNALGWQPTCRLREEDTYYTSRHKDFIATEECLRIRRSEAGAELTWKPPTSESMKQARQYWKQEIDLNLADQVDTMRQLLKCLEFYEYVVVTKSRTIYRAAPRTLVCLDEIKGLGWFVEIETKARSSSAATRLNLAVLSELGLDGAQRVSIPYRDLVKESGRQLRVRDLRGRQERTHSIDLDEQTDALEAAP